MPITTYRPPVTAQDQVKAGLALHMAAVATGVPVDRMRGARLPARHSHARRLALYLAHVTFGWTLDQVADVFGVNRATAGTACRWAEDRRDRPDEDALMDRLEALLREALATPRCEWSR